LKRKNDKVKNGTIQRERIIHIMKTEKVFMASMMMENSFIWWSNTKQRFAAQ